MKKILPLIIVGVLIISGFGAVALNNDYNILKSQDIINKKMGDRGNKFM